jgi:hypothetical protein
MVQESKARRMKRESYALAKVVRERKNAQGLDGP